MNNFKPKLTPLKDFQSLAIGQNLTNALMLAIAIYVNEECTIDDKDKKHLPANESNLINSLMSKLLDENIKNNQNLTKNIENILKEYKIPAKLKQNIEFAFLAHKNDLQNIEQNRFTISIIDKPSKTIERNIIEGGKSKQIKFKNPEGFIAVY